MARPRVDRATIELDRNGLQVLDRSACLELLATARIGRLAYVSEGSPRIIPLSVALEDEAVLFRLSTGDALTAIEAGQLVALEVDDVAADVHCGWSVTVLGGASELRRPPSTRVERLPRSWLRGTAGRLFRLPTDHIEGRRLLRPPT